MSEERCESCGSTCVCCCTCDGDFVDDDDEVKCPAPVPCPPFKTVQLDITKMWFGDEHGWLTYEEVLAKGLHKQGPW